MREQPIKIRKYFVDEAGDGNLFSRKGHVIVGTPGCSRFFIIGILDIPDPSSLSKLLIDLRTQILSDPYFKDIPSIQPEARKTALAFHAKDDIPEVRREVFRLLRDISDLRFFAVVADKFSVLEYVRQRNARDSSYRYHPNELYDYLVRRLFRDRLHKDKGYEIYFAKRGRSDRTKALYAALQSARERFFQKWAIKREVPIRVIPSQSVKTHGLQAADYFLWALQRLYERKEERFVAYLWDSFSLVHDIDDRRASGYGVYYSKRKQLTAAALDGRK
jgi:hypothetical protein